MTSKTNASPPSTENRPETTGTSVRSAAELGGVKVVESGDLFERRSEIGIMHEGSLYRLKITRQGKLILNK